MAMILGIEASLCKNGNSDVLLRNLLKGAADVGENNELTRLIDYQFQPCIACEECRKDREFKGK